ncbi:hypothetical protein PTSG_04032 [Salpingoeca rosetta]|uniref:Uncharacterized protein n=1 Tax=Salpingoeca rosetta (strain ATCC 50818 / BSB-021) TaxID=946362 RepID=F2U7K8_SALR5|nr:uncharacterized protein PTSG_04032 [Salpingoeca rosetta]EGD83425.1 hypothetical protein PTSG_04032 [Salpingoeca rosetta]|eukprot:XP_004994929.1 hypothetical protein PTSG_04032 [Salpingoeca rosetta]
MAGVVVASESLGSPIHAVAFGRALASANLVAAACGQQIIVYELTSAAPAPSSSSSSFAFEEKNRIVCSTTITHLCWSPMDNAICATGTDFSLRRFDVKHTPHQPHNRATAEGATWVETFCVPAHAQPVNDCQFNANGSLIATCSDDGTVRIHHGQTGRALSTYDLLHPITRVLWHRGRDESNRFMVADTRGRIRIYAYGSGDNRAIMTLFTQEPLADLHWQLLDDSKVAAITDTKWYTFNTQLSSLPQAHGALDSPGCSIAWSPRDTGVLAIGMADRFKVIRLTADGDHDVLAEERGGATGVSFHSAINACVVSMGATLLLFAF